MRLYILQFLLYSLMIKGSYQIENEYILLMDDGIEDYSLKSCQLMDEFGILVQLSLVFTGIITLLYKRSRESPKRSLQIWSLDVSKQFIGAGMIHFINIGISYSASQPTKGPTTNLCVWYFLNVAVDTTLGVFIIWCWFNLLSSASEKLRTYYGIRVYDKSSLFWSWIQQLFLFLLAEILTKICLYIIVINSPWLFWLGSLCISWTNDNERYQVLFVMLIFPLVMNAIQFWLTDAILKEDIDTQNTSESKKQQTLPSNYFNSPVITVFIDQTERTPLLFPPPKHRLAS